MKSNPSLRSMHLYARHITYVLLLFLLLSCSSFAVHAASASNGWKSIDGKWYYYKSGKPLTGMKTISGNTYYLDPSNGGAMKTGFVRIKRSGKTYSHYFMDKNYVRYDSSKEGQMMTGWTTVKGRTYYFADSRFPKLPKGVMISGFKKIGGNTFYFADSRCPDHRWGSQVTGFAKIKDKLYYFADKKCKSEKVTGKMMTGLVTINGKKYYFASNGIIKTGFQKIDGSYHYFADSRCKDISWASMAVGLVKIKNSTYYFDKYGVMQKGWVKVDGTRKYFDKNGKNKIPVVVLDPGHSSEVAGGKEPVGPGASEKKDADTAGTRGVSTRVYEYELVLQVSLKLRTSLEARGYRVIMTRSTNKGTYSCVERAAVANDNHADIFVRVHANADPKDASRTGAMTLCITKKNPYIAKMYKQSRLLSDKILNSYVKATGCKKEYVWERDDLSGNNWSTVPTTLIELGYMTNAAEDKKMQNADYQKKMVSGIAAGIDQYFNSVR